jgi:hypothetical protein
MDVDDRLKVQLMFFPSLVKTMLVFEFLKIDGGRKSYDTKCFFIVPFSPESGLGGHNAKVVKYGADWALEFTGTKNNSHMIVFDDKELALYACALINEKCDTLDIGGTLKNI